MIKFVKGGVYVDENDTGIYQPVEKELVPAYLTEYVDLEHRPTLRDVLKAVRDNPVLSLIFRRIAFIEDHIDDEYIKTDDGVDLLHVTQIASYHYSEKTPYINFDAMDKDGPNEQGFYPLNMDYEDKEYSSMSMYVDLHATKTGDDETYSISMTPLCELLDVPIVFGKGTMVSYIDHQMTHHVCDDTEITMFDAINAILDDITFHGDEDHKQEVLGDLQETMDKINQQKGDDDD